MLYGNNEQTQSRLILPGLLAYVCVENSTIIGLDDGICQSGTELQNEPTMTDHQSNLDVDMYHIQFVYAH